MNSSQSIILSSVINKLDSHLPTLYIVIIDRFCAKRMYSVYCFLDLCLS